MSVLAEIPTIPNLGDIAKFQSMYYPCSKNHQTDLSAQIRFISLVHTESDRVLAASLEIP